MISRTDPERELYEARLKAWRDATAEREDARGTGLAEGRAEGRAEMRRASSFSPRFRGDWPFVLIAFLHATTCP